MRLTYLHYLCDGDTALNHIRQFTAAAESAGHQLEVCSLEPTQQSSGHDQSARDKVRRVLKHRLSFYLHEPKKLLSNLPSYRVAAKCLRSQRPDAVLVRNGLLSLSAIVAAKRAGLPLILEVNSPAVESRRYLDQYCHLPRLPEAIERKQLSMADGITVVSTALQEHLIEQYELPPEKFTVVPNGADLDLFRPGSAPDPALESTLGPATIVGFIGSFEKWHGPELLRDMVLRVAEDRPETRFLLVGDGPGREAVEQALHPIADRVQFTGRVPHERIPGITALLDVAVMPESNFYGSPLKVIEWMAAGRAIVAPDYGPLCEIIDTGRQGILFERGNVEDLVAAVVKLTDNAELRQELGEAAHIRAVKSLSWSHNAAKVIDACQRAIEQHSQSSRQTR